jgi:hypothetical protein
MECEAYFARAVIYTHKILMKLATACMSKCAKDGEAYFARAVIYTHKMLMK